MMQEISATVKCSRCKKTNFIKISRERFEQFSEGGLMKVAIDHGDHVFVVWIDSHGYQRASDVFENIVERRGAEGDEIRISDIIDFYGSEFFAKVLTASICGYKMFIDLEKKYLKFLDYLITYFLREFPNVVSDRSSADVVISVSDINTTLPGESYFINLINELKSIENDKLKILRLKMAMETIKRLAENVKRELSKTKKPISLLELAKKIKVKDRNLLILAINRALYWNRGLRRLIKEKTYIFSS